MNKQTQNQKSHHGEIVWGIAVFIVMAIGMYLLAMWRGV